HARLRARAAHSIGPAPPLREAFEIACDNLRAADNASARRKLHAEPLTEPGTNLGSYCLCNQTKTAIHDSLVRLVFPPSGLAPDPAVDSAPAFASSPCRSIRPGESGL